MLSYKLTNEIDESQKTIFFAKKQMILKVIANMNFLPKSRRFILQLLRKLIFLLSVRLSHKTIKQHQYKKN